MVISSIEDVERLRSSPAQLWKLRGPLELRIPDIPKSQRELLESRLNELAGVCGCAEGSVAGGIALIAVVLFWSQFEIEFSYQSLFVTGATVIGASLLAKLVRVINARLRLRQVLGDPLLTSPRYKPPPSTGVMP